MKEILITSSALILALLALRGVFRRTISRRVQYALWALVLARLLIPVSLPAAGFSLLTAAEPVGQTVSAQLRDQTVYVPIAREPLAQHPTAPDMAPDLAMPSGGSSVWVAETDETAVQYHRLTAGELLRLVWLTGMALMAAFFLFTNLRFWRKLRKVRTPYAVENCKHPVYLVESGLPSPCLFGFFRPAIYLTSAAVETAESLRHVIAHESTHARHGDPLWSLLRCACLAVYWFNPLVWAAAIASKADCELACDEGALKRLGETERIPYGRTLLSLIPVRTGPGNPLLSATTMTAGKRQLKDRITRIAENRQTKAVALLALAAIAAAVCAITFTGGRAEEGPRPLTGDELAYFNEEFFNGKDFNIRNQFLTSLYETPAEIDLFALFYCGAGLPEGTDRAERQAVVDTGYGGNDPGVDLTKCSAANLDAVLLETTGLTLAETRQVDLDAFTYLPEYDAYYYFHGDTNYRANVTFSAGEREGNHIRLYCTDGYFGGPNVITCVTLEAQDDGSYWFVSHLYAERPAISTVYPEGEPALTIPLDGLTAYAPETVEMERHTDDPVEQYENHMVYDDLFHVYRSTDGNVYAALAREPATESDGTPLWDVECFFTFPADAEPRLITVGDFFDLFGRSGAVISYPGQISENHYNTINDYYYIENGEPVLLARAYGETAVIDLDGDGENELCAAAGNTAQVFFRRDGQVYEADVAALLAESWPQAAYPGFGSWDGSRRSLPLYGEVPIPDADARGTAFRTLYFNGESLLIYKDDTTYTDHVSDEIKAPEAILAAAKAFVLEQFQGEHAGYYLVNGEFEAAPVEMDDWRLERLSGPFAETAGGLSLQIWRLDYKLHTATPERVMMAGGRYMTEDGWVSPGYPDCDYLYFTVNTDAGPSLLFTAMENDCVPGTEIFFSDMAWRLLEMGRLAPSDLEGRELLTMLSTQPASFLNRMSEEWPAAEQTAALETLGGYLTADSDSDVQSAYAECARYVGIFGEDLTAGGRAAWDHLRVLTAGEVPADPAADVEFTG